jgi:branched-chain amino acid transport system permease protein
MRCGLNFWLTIPIAALNATLFAFVIGYITLRLRGTYFALATFGFVVMMLAVFNNLSNITGGHIGLMPIPPASIGGLILVPTQRLVRSYVALAFLFLTVFIIDRIIHSRVGRAFIVIRENEDLAKSSGVNTFWYKLLSFCISSFFAGMTGAIYAAYQGMISPADITLVIFFQILAACIVGGLGTLVGPIIGTVFVQVLPEAIKGFSKDYYYLIFGVFLIIVVIWAPKGIAGGIESIRRRIVSAKTFKKVE